MTTRKRALTAQIKPATRNAIMDQLACAADELIRIKSPIRKRFHLDEVVAFALFWAGFIAGRWIL